MPRVHRSGEKIPEFGAAIQGGIAMVMHQPAEMEYTQSLCAMAADSNSPLHAIYGMLDINPDFAESRYGRGKTMARKDGPEPTSHIRACTGKRLMKHHDHSCNRGDDGGVQSNRDRDDLKR